MTAVWDARYEVCLSPTAPSALTVRVLPAQSAVLLKDVLPPGVPARAGLTLPAFWHGGEPIAMPAIGSMTAGTCWRHTACIPILGASSTVSSPALAQIAALCSIKPQLVPAIDAHP